MHLKYGNLVKIVKNPFFNGTPGNVINYREVEWLHREERMYVQYLVKIEDQEIWFDEDCLELLRE